MSATANALDFETLSTLLVEEINAGRLTLPVMPDVATKVKQEAANPASSAKTLSQIIATDGALAARILKMANSAIYAGLSEIKNLDLAIGRLGSAMVVALVIGAAGKETFRSEDKVFNKILSHAWKRALAASAASRLLAVQLQDDAEEAFLAGLLHASGEPVLLESIRTLMLAGTVERPEDELLAQVLSEYACLAGSRLLAKWGLPESLFTAVEFQDHPDDAPAAYARNAWMVSLSAAFGRGESGLSKHPAIKQLGIEADTLEEILAQAHLDAREIAHSL